MGNYHMITLEESFDFFPRQFREKYNDAVETIWHLQQKIKELYSENAALWKTYDEMSDQLFG